MSASRSNSRKRVDAVLDGLKGLRELTIRQYFKSVNRTTLADPEREALEKHGETTVHDFLVEALTAKMLTQDFSLLGDIPRKPQNDFPLLYDIYSRALL